MAFQFNRLIDLSGPKGWIKKTGYFHTGSGTFDRTFAPFSRIISIFSLEYKDNVHFKIKIKLMSPDLFNISPLHCLRNHPGAYLLFRWSMSASVSVVENGLILMTWLSRVIWSCEFRAAIQRHLTISKCDPGYPFNWECKKKNSHVSYLINHIINWCKFTHIKIEAVTFLDASR